MVVERLAPHTKLIRQLTRGMLNASTQKILAVPSPVLTKPVEVPPAEETARAKESREMILQTKLTAVELLQVYTSLHGHYTFCLIPVHHGREEGLSDHCGPLLLQEPLSL